MPLGRRTDYGDAKYAGLHLAFNIDIESALQESLLCGFDFVIAPLVRPDYRPPAEPTGPGGQFVQPFGRDDVLYLRSTQRNSQIVGAVSTWIDPDSGDSSLYSASTTSLKQELAWAAHLGLQAVVLPRPEPAHIANYAQVVQQALSALSHMALWMTVPLEPAPPVAQISERLAASTLQPTTSTSSNGSAGVADANSSNTVAVGDAWDWWNKFRTLCDFHPLLGCMLQLGKVLPSRPLLDRWLGEPVKALLVPTHIFTTNKRGYPVLSKAHQVVIATFFEHHAQVVLCGECLHHVAPQPSQPEEMHDPNVVTVDSETGFAIHNPGEHHPLRPYWEYLCYLFRKLENLSDQDRLEGEYRDYLQAPLQPLQDNLESQTYETFEKDVTKYSQYEEAVYRALLDRVPDGPEASSTVTVLMVVGAGRGPLVRSSMRAAQRAKRQLRVFAVEKNPNAVVHIQSLLRSEGWEDKVTIVSADMRHWEAPVKADILVSELLGSFGDNELSPECLDGAQRFLQPNGISIPASYTSFWAPVTTHKLYNDVKAYKDLEHFETPYVVKFHRCHLLAPPQEMLRFEHPNWSSYIDNSRYKCVRFERSHASGAGVLHGFAGYFESVLYKDVTLSIHPSTHTPGMFSWFPIFFPLKEPVYLPAGAAVDAHLWRCCASHKVWYEWSITAPVPTPVHNVAGRSYYVGL